MNFTCDDFGYIKISCQSAPHSDRVVRGIVAKKAAAVKCVRNSVQRFALLVISNGQNRLVPFAGNETNSCTNYHLPAKVDVERIKVLGLWLQTPFIDSVVKMVFDSAYNGE